MNSDGLQAVAGPVVNLHAVAPHGHDQTLQALLDRLTQLEHYKNHLEHENRQMHQQLQVLSGFLNVVSTSVRTTENMLFPAPDIPLEASQTMNGPTPCAAQTPTAGARRKSTTVLDDSNIKRVKLEGAQAALATALNYIQHLSSNVSLRLSKVKGKSALHADSITIYRIELSRSGQFEKYLFLPNDAIPAYGVRSWQHREAIPQEVIKMVSLQPLPLLLTGKAAACIAAFLQASWYTPKIAEAVDAKPGCPMVSLTAGLWLRGHVINVHAPVFGYHSS
jgi:hypothetical protein